MQVLAQSPFRWTLFEIGPGTYVVSVLCGRVAQYGVEVRLSEEEARAYEVTGEEKIDALASAVHAEPGRYENRALVGFSKEKGWQDALDAWTEKQRRRDDAAH